MPFNFGLGNTTLSPPDFKGVDADLQRQEAANASVRSEHSRTSAATGSRLVNPRLFYSIEIFRGRKALSKNTRPRRSQDDPTELAI